ncbi:MAG: tripartite tricarboxylate transporter TctB family protein [Desulfobacterales bacterium]|jgi:putative tricarboxylic transport membrane protein|nr:tripartite tricarboxylate transporter TctB family protein [Desulfobacterales bacterium]
MDTLRKAVTRTRVEGLVILLVALGYLWEAHNVPEFYQLPGVPGPTTFPRLLGIVFALAGLWLLVSPQELRVWKKAAGAPAAAQTPEPAPAAGRGLLRRIAADWHFYVIWAVILAYLWAMPDLGFPLATFLLLVAFIFLLGETRWHVVLGLAAAATILIYVSFRMGLNVRLPLGILEAWFK